MNALLLADALELAAKALREAAPTPEPVAPATPSHDRLTLAEVAKGLRRHPETIREWISTGYLEAFRERGRVWVRRAVYEQHRANQPSAAKRGRRGPPRLTA